MKFFCDVNVYRLAKYLRFAGFDTKTRRDFSLLQISNICKKENRIFITRNKNIKIFLFSNVNTSLPKIEVLIFENYLEQIEYILKKYPLNPDHIATRCLECNVLLKPSNEDVLYCPRCGKKFWKGTHYDNMLKVVGGK